MRFEVLMDVTVKITISGDVMLCTLRECTNILEEPAASIFCTEEQSSRFLWNIALFLRSYMASHP
jgi:hypothetical protein